MVWQPEISAGAAAGGDWRRYLDTQVTDALGNDDERSDSRITNTNFISSGWLIPAHVFVSSHIHARSPSVPLLSFGSMHKYNTIIMNIIIIGITSTADGHKITANKQQYGGANLHKGVAPQSSSPSSSVESGD